MRVLVFLPSVAIGGSERMTITLVNSLSSSGCQVLLVLNTGGALRGEIASPVEVTELGVRRIRYAILPLVRLIRRWHPDVVFAPKPDAAVGLAVAWRLAGRRARLVVRESNHRTAQGFPRRGLFSSLLGWAYRQADGVVAPTNAVADDVRSRYGLQAGRIQVLYNPVDVRRIVDAISQSLGSSDPHEKAQASIHLLAVGRLIRQKGFDLLLRALAQLESGDVRLTILGDGPERVPLGRLAEELGLASQMSLPGFVANPYPWMASADIFVLPSRWEGFPNALVEAMALGLPVVATRCLAGPEEIVTHETDGLLCEPESPSALAAQLKRLVSDRVFANRLGHAAQKTAKRFDARRVAAEYLELFRGVSRVESAFGALPPREAHEEQPVVS